jgi:hypothetical protein
MTTEPPDREAILGPLLAPIVRFMVMNDVRSVAIEAAPSRASTAVLERPEAPDGSITCTASPDAPRLTGIYRVRDVGRNALVDGPAGIPRDLLHPLCEALSEYEVAKLVIEAIPDDPASAGASGIASLGPNYLPGEFFEDDVPESGPSGATVVAFQVHEDGVA